MNLKKYLDDLEKISPLEALDELCFFYKWLRDKDPQDKGRWLVSRLRREEKKYLAKGIPKGKWPIFLRNPSWEDEIWKRLGIERPKDQTTSKKESVRVQEEAEMITTQEALPKRRIERGQPKTGDPFQSDDFGVLLGEEEGDFRGLGNRRR